MHVCVGFVVAVVLACCCHAVVCFRVFFRLLLLELCPCVLLLKFEYIGVGLKQGPTTTQWWLPAQSTASPRQMAAHSEPPQKKLSTKRRFPLAKRQPEKRVILSAFRWENARTPKNYSNAENGERSHLPLPTSNLVYPNQLFFCTVHPLCLYPSRLGCAAPFRPRCRKRRINFITFCSILPGMAS